MPDWQFVGAFISLWAFLAFLIILAYLADADIFKKRK